MPDLRGLLADPEFQALPLERRGAILTRINPDLAKEYVANHAQDAPQAQPAGAGRNTSPSTIGPLPWYQKDVVGGVSVQDALNALPVIGGAVGGMIGGAGGTAFGAGFGGAPGAIGGAALGGAGGEAANQLARRAVGIGGVPSTPGEAAARIGKEGAVQGVVEGAGRGLARGVSAVGRGMVENAVRPPITLQREFPKVIDTIVKERLPVGAAPFGKVKGSERAAARLKEESKAVKRLLTRAMGQGKTFESSKIAEPVLKLLDDIAEQPLQAGDMARLETMLDEFMTTHKGPLTPLAVQKLKQKAQAIAKPLYRAQARGEPLTAAQSMRARFNDAIAKGAKGQMETVPGVKAGEATKRDLIGAQRALRQAEMRRLPLMAEAGAAVIGSTAGMVTVPTDDPVSRSIAGWLVTRGVLSPRAMSRSGLVLTSDQVKAITRQFPRMADFLLRKATTQESPEGQAAQR